MNATTYPVRRCEGGEILGHAATRDAAEGVFAEETMAGLRGEPCKVEFDEDAECYYAFEAAK